MKLNLKKNASKLATALATIFVAVGAHATDSLGGSVTTTNKVGLGGLMGNAATNFMQSLPFWEMLFYLGSFIAMGIAILTFVKWKKSRGQDGDLGMAGVYMLAGILAFAVPDLMGNGIMTFFGSSAATIKVDSSTTSSTTTPSF